MKPPWSQSGFTLLELMAAIGIMGILLGIGVPALNNLVQESRLSSSARDFVVDLSLARSEAALRAQRVTVCTSTNMTSCTNASWGDGRLIFTDGGVGGVIDGGDQILSQTPALDPAITSTPFNAATAYFISYGPTGRLTNWGIIRLCTTGHQRRTINIRRSGASSLDKDAVTC